MDADGFFYDAEGKLAAFDTNLTQKVKAQSQILCDG